jgi:hypothetical protein
LVLSDATSVSEIKSGELRFLFSQILPRAFERGGDQEFIQFLAVAKGSCGEVRAQLYVALDQCYFSLESFETLSKTATEVSELISGLMKYLKDSELRGSKYC